MAKLKVFRTPIGFHDAYVAAPSRKAALEAWGSDKDLFARGIAEQITDAALSESPLAHPGTVFTVPRGSAEDQLAALANSSKPALSAKRAKAERDPAQRPSHADVDTAEDALWAAANASATSKAHSTPRSLHLPGVATRCVDSMRPKSRS